MVALRGSGKHGNIDLDVSAMPVWVSSVQHRAVISSLVEARKAAGMTQRDVAAALGKPPSFVGKVEGIERNLSVLEFLAWTAAVGADPAEILPRVTLPLEI